MLVEVDPKEHTDHTKSNHVGNLLFIGFGRGISVKRPPEQETPAVLNRHIQKRRIYIFRRVFLFENGCTRSTQRYEKNFGREKKFADFYIK